MTRKSDEIKTGDGRALVIYVGGAVPYLWIGDEDGNYLDTVEISEIEIHADRDRGRVRA